MKRLLAIDPGASGGVAWRDESGLYSCEPMPQTPGEVCDLLRGIVAGGPSMCRMEKVNGYMGNAAPGSAMFRFGQGVGYIEGCLAAWGVPLIEVPPQRWIKALGLGTRGELDKTAWKRKLQAEAQRRFPQLKVTLKTADALLILAAAETEERT
jgi:hypothetical protein